jgi:hypothetical protein
LIKILSKYIGTLGLQQIGPPIFVATLKIIPIMKVFEKEIVAKNICDYNL